MEEVFSPQAAPAPLSAGLYSIRSHFDASCNVLLTGASGYIGSLILEKLLRSTNVGHVYVLLRTRRGASPAERLSKVLQGPLFHLIGEEQASRVTAVAGDILQPGLGLSPEDEAMLVERVDTVIHSAADIRLDAPIHQTLKANYLGSTKVVQLAARMGRLRSLVYVSTCYVNFNHPVGATVQERLYSLKDESGREVQPDEIVQGLLSLPEDAAAARAQQYIEKWVFKNTYALGKHLAEKKVAALQREYNLPLCIVRPSLVSAISAEPYAGYVGNFAGPVGAVAAYLMGLYDDQPEAVGSNGWSVWDVVPGDVVAHATIAAAAAAGTPAARHVIAAKPLGPPAGAVEVARHFDNDVIIEETEEESREALDDGTVPLMLVQVATSCTYPLSASFIFNLAVMWCAAHPRTFTLALGRARGMDPNHEYNEAAWRRHMETASKRVGAMAWVLSLGGKRTHSMVRMVRMSLKTYQTVNTSNYDIQVFFSADNLVSLEETLDASERSDFTIVWRPPAQPRTASELAEEAGLEVVSESEDIEAVRSGGRGKHLCGCFSSPKVQEDMVAAAVVYNGAGPKVAGGEGALEHQMRVQQAREGGWMLHYANIMAFMYSQLYHRQVPEVGQVPKALMRKLAPLLSEEHKIHDGRVRHAFFAYK